MGRAGVVRIKPRSRSARYLPWLLALTAGLMALGFPSLRPVPPQPQTVLFAGPTPLPLDPNQARRLAGISADAAALTGSLALVDAGARPDRALGVAARVRELAQEAAAVPSDADLAAVLSELSGALERYAGGDPAAVARIRELSARNARLRATYDTYSGGE